MFDDRYSVSDSEPTIAAEYMAREDATISSRFLSRVMTGWHNGEMNVVRFILLE